jgi:hypothetical protein
MKHYQTWELLLYQSLLKLIREFLNIQLVDNKIFNQIENQNISKVNFN